MVSTPTTSSEGAPVPQRPSIFPQQNRRRHAQPHSDKPQQTIPPSIIQRSVHVRREQRKPKPRQTPQNSRSPDGGRGETGVRVDKISLNALEAHDDTRAEDGGADIGDDPVSVVLRRPTVQKEADGHEQAPGNHERNTELRLADAVVALLQLLVYTVVDRCRDLRAEEESHSERDIIKTANTDRFVIPCLPQHWECRKYKVHQAVKISHVNGKDLNDDLRAEQAEGSYQRVLENICKRSLWMFVLGVKGSVARLFPKFLGLLMEQLWRVSFSQKE